MSPAPATTDPAHPTDHTEPPDHTEPLQTTDHPARSRIPAAFRLQFVVPQLITIPLLVFVASWAISIGIGFWIDAIIGGRAPADHIYTGASQAALWTLLFMAGYAASHTFPFSLALSYSRRVFLTGAVLAFLAVSVGMGVLFALAAAVEQWTDGFGINVYTFALPYLMQDGVWGLGLMAASLSLTLMLVGFGFAMLYKRFSLLMLWTIILGLVVVLAVAALLITQAGAWPSIWQWFVQQTPLTLAGWLLVPTVALTLIDYWMIRRATP